MKELEKALAWFDRLQADANEIAARVSKISAQVSANNYEPKEALADWMFFVGKGWLCWLPEPAPTGVPEVYITYSDSIDDIKHAVGLRRLRASAPAGNPALMGDLQGPGGKSILASKIELLRISQGTELLVTAIGLKGQAQVDYRGTVQVGGVDVATILIKVTA